MKGISAPFATQMTAFIVLLLLCLILEMTFIIQINRLIVSNVSQSFFPFISEDIEKLCEIEERFRLIFNNTF